VFFSLLYLGFCQLFGLVRSSRRSVSDNEVELLVLRHQVRILERQLHGRLRYRPADRAILAALSRLLPRVRWRSFLVTPETLLRWHREAANRTILHQTLGTRLSLSSLYKPVTSTFSASGRRESNPRSQLGNKRRGDSGELERTSANHLSSSAKVAGSACTGANDSGCAINVPWLAVELELPAPLVELLQAEADLLGVSLGVVVAARLGGSAADGSKGDRP
jgi:hypothetical protein